ncbi:right-handed parallel beta-helix repeat-containing protein [Microbacterium sp. NPDC056569]|uniref:right-handed parallel beta-helix repeat-containing protein n=1 Tax=Microbacterium sp. NPDC056569 TaxID=3345867 RepID=UPI003672DFA9
MLPRAVAALGLVVLLSGCSAPEDPDPTPSTDSRQAECAAAAAGVADAVAEVVAGYEGPLSPDGSMTASPEPLPSATPGGEADDPLSEAVAAARQTRERLGCDTDRFEQDLRAGLDDVRPQGSIATAVWRRVSATLLGEIPADAAERTFESGEDLAEVVAQIPEGGTLVLPAGTIEVEDTLVLLDGVTLRGAGRDATVIRSSAPDAAVLIAAAGLVSIADLTVEVAGTNPASAVVAGPWASVVLAGARVAGATIADGIGGAGVYLSSGADDVSGEQTTLEVTDTLFERNGWAGLAVTGKHRVSIEASAFSGNGEVGLLFMDATSGSVRSSTFADNTVGVAVAGTASPTLLSSSASGGSVALQTDDSAAPTVDGLDIGGATTAAAILGGESGGWIGGVACHDVPFGIVVSSGAAPTMGSNSCPLSRGGS